MIKVKNLLSAVWQQGPLKRAWRNFIVTGNAWGMFSENSHVRADTGKLKVMYNTKKTATKAAENLSKKNNTHFSIYKCVFCDGYHIGKNRGSVIVRSINILIPEKIKEFTCKVYSPENIPLADLTYLEMINFCIQISQKSFGGYYFIFKDEKLFIEDDGDILVWPKGFYDQHETALKEFLDF